MKRVVLATGNAGKLREMQTLLAPLGFDVVSQSELGVQEAEETGLTFVENAIIKARNAAQATGLPAIADDSGLEVDALAGQPGIRSARFAGPEANDTDNVRLLLERLHEVPASERSARFQCLMVFMRHAEDPTPLIAQGSWEGHILTTPRGANGFGYDPVFEVPETGTSAAELEPAEKNRRSHRARAAGILVNALRERGQAR
jgi:XTP/dITP diphosphohydrolase